VEQLALALAELGSWKVAVRVRLLGGLGLFGGFRT
jgi:hypothetical protein